MSQKITPALSFKPELTKKGWAPTQTIEPILVRDGRVIYKYILSQPTADIEISLFEWYDECCALPACSTIRFTYLNESYTERDSDEAETLFMVYERNWPDEGDDWFSNITERMDDEMHTLFINHLIDIAQFAYEKYKGGDLANVYFDGSNIGDGTRIELMYDCDKDARIKRFEQCADILKNNLKIQLMSLRLTESIEIKQGQWPHDDALRAITSWEQASKFPKAYTNFIPLVRMAEHEMTWPEIKRYIFNRENLGNGDEIDFQQMIAMLNKTFSELGYKTEIAAEDQRLIPVRNWLDTEPVHVSKGDLIIRGSIYPFLPTLTGKPELSSRGWKAEKLERDSCRYVLQQESLDFKIVLHEYAQPCVYPHMEYSAIKVYYENEPPPLTKEGSDVLYFIWDENMPEYGHDWLSDIVFEMNVEQHEAFTDMLIRYAKSALKSYRAGEMSRCYYDGSWNTTYDRYLLADIGDKKDQVKLIDDIQTAYESWIK
jgi:hypothetical protein